MLIVPKQYSSLEFIEPIQWEDIFQTWKAGEAWQASWKKHWESRGFSSWDEWREAYAAPLHPKSLKWFLYEIKNPLQDLPFFFAVPSRSWIDKAYGGETTKQLKNLLDLPIIQDNPKILEIKEKFPPETMLTGLLWQDEIILVEGMHRACALAGWDARVPFKGKVKLALAEWNEKEIPVIGGNYKKK